jgi:hypothetical protein
MLEYLSRLPFLKNRCSVRVKKADFTERPLSANAFQHQAHVFEQPRDGSLEHQRTRARLEFGVIRLQISASG